MTPAIAFGFVCPLLWCIGFLCSTQPSHHLVAIRLNLFSKPLALMLSRLVRFHFFDRRNALPYEIVNRIVRSLARLNVMVFAQRVAANRCGYRAAWRYSIFRSAVFFALLRLRAWAEERAA